MSEKSGEEAVPAGTGTAEEKAEEEGEEGEEGEGEEEEVTVTGGNTAFSLEKQQIGEGGYVPGLRIADIRWADHGDCFRIVFETEKSDGSAVSEVPNRYTLYPASSDPASENYHELFVSFLGIPRYRYDYPRFQDDDTPVGLGDDLVKTMERVGVADNEQLRFEIKLRVFRGAPGRLISPAPPDVRDQPMRVILDIRKV